MIWSSLAAPVTSLTASSFPALFHRFLDGQFSQPTKIIGVSRHDFDNSSYRASIAKALKQFAGGSSTDEAIKGFLAMIHYVVLDIGSDLGWDRLEHQLEKDRDAGARLLPRDGARSFRGHCPKTCRAFACYARVPHHCRKADRQGRRFGGIHQ